MNRIAVQAKLDAANHLLRHIAEDYYTGARAYHLLTAGTPERVRCHARLKTLTQIGNGLADALQALRPHWEAVYNLAGYDPRNDTNPFQAGGGCRGCLHNPGGDP